MSAENLNDKHNIKTLLFSRAIEKHTVPITEHQIFSCLECGDKFIFESSYQSHINRMSAQITYLCRHCGEQNTFYNRCNLIRHIRSHYIKTTTINVADLNIEPLPLSHFNLTLQSIENNSIQGSKREIIQNQKVNNLCHECNQDVSVTINGVVYQELKRHFMQFTNKVYTCPVCLFALPTQCGLRAHLRLHLRCPPYYCPECGKRLPNRNVQYPYSHDCEGFKMMRATARLKCPVNDSCPLLHPSDYKTHAKQSHLKKVYKCQICVVACFNETTMKKHLETHCRDTKSLLFYQCELCPGSLVVNNQIEQHLKCHAHPPVYPCWTCGAVSKNVNDLLIHHSQEHKDCDINITQMFPSIMNENKTLLSKQRYRIVKRCGKCKKSFVFNCKNNEIITLPNMCPYNCCTNLDSKIVISDDEPETHNSQLICYICKSDISQDWEDIKKHFATYHTKYRCLDINIRLPRLDIKKYIKDKRVTKKKAMINNSKNNYVNTRKRLRNKDIEIICDNKDQVPCNNIDDKHTCNKCEFRCDSKDLLELHMITHRDPCMAYQCLECGQSFVVKPTFSKHLLLDHNIINVDDYINSKPCYNANALSKLQQNDEVDDPVCENQCSICRDQFETVEELEKHFRVHGMAFLKKNTTNKINI